MRKYSDLKHTAKIICPDGMERTIYCASLSAGASEDEILDGLSYSTTANRTLVMRYEAVIGFIDNKCKVEFQGRTYKIESVVDPTGDRRWLHVGCE